MYAVLDLESTGGKYNEEGITEVAIYKFDGQEVVDQFISLVNPERPIQHFVVRLTGINNKMLRNAPKFYEIAKRVIEITQDCIIVAHNAEFDYRILQLEFDRLGYDYQRKSLCTVELAKDLLPEEESYSLGKLVRSLGIPLTDRHRANGDAMATVKLFKLLLSRDTSKKIIQSSVNLNQKKKLDTKFQDLIEQVPSSTGVYYLHNANGKIIFIDKSKNMKKRVAQHFTGSNKKSKQLQAEVEAVSAEPTGSMLIALLKSREENLLNRPKQSRPGKKLSFTQQITTSKDDEGYLNLKIERADTRKESLATFTNIHSAKAHLKKIVDEYDLSLLKTSLSNNNKEAQKLEPAESYNVKVRRYKEDQSLNGKNQIIIDRGRSREERAAILIEKGQLKGYGYYNLNHQLSSPDILKRIITPLKNSADMRHLVQDYLRRNKVLKVMQLEDID